MISQPHASPSPATATSPAESPAEPRKRWHRIVDIAELTSHDGAEVLDDRGQPVTSVAFVINSKWDDIQAQREAHAMFAELSKTLPGGADTFKTDEQILFELKNAYVVHRCMRLADDLDRPMWLSPRWMLEHFDNDQIGTFVRFYNQCRKAKGPTPWDITPTWVTTVRDACVAASADGMADRPLAAFTREYIDDFLGSALCQWASESRMLLAEIDSLRNANREQLQGPSEGPGEAGP